MAHLVGHIKSAQQHLQTCKCVVCLQTPLQTPAQSCKPFSTANQAHTHLTWPSCSCLCCRQRTKRTTEVWEGLSVTGVPNELQNSFLQLWLWSLLTMFTWTFCFLYFSTFSKSISCLSSLNPGNKPYREVGSFSIMLPTAHRIVDPLSPHPDVIAKK